MTWVLSVLRCPMPPPTLTLTLTLTLSGEVLPSLGATATAPVVAEGGRAGSARSEAWGEGGANGGGREEIRVLSKVPYVALQHGVVSQAEAAELIRMADQVGGMGLGLG